MATRPTLHRAVAKTKNTASDYNDNFDMMMDFVDESIGEAKDYVDDFMPSVTGQAGKFLTNDGTDTSWVSLGNQPFGDYINGLVITKSSDDKINVSAGSCYDYAKAVILANGTQATKQNGSQLASTTYYVYIIDGESIDFLITTESSTPTLPTGSTTYRQIGSYITNSDNKIDSINYYGNIINKNNNITEIINAVMPDYTAGVSKTSGISYTAAQAGWLEVLCSDYNSGTTIVIDGTTRHHGTDNQQLSVNDTMFPISKGTTYTVTLGRSAYSSITFYPCKGVN